jgi:hypothetical protein
MNVKEVNHRAKDYITGKQSGKNNMSKAKNSNQRNSIIENSNSDDRIDKLTEPLRIVDRRVDCDLFLRNESLEHSLSLSPKCP